MRESAFYLLFVTRQLLDQTLNLLLELLYRPAPAALPPPPRSVLSLSADRLARRIRTRQLTSQLAVASCVARIRQLEPRLRCLAEERFTEALAEARAADAEISRLRSELVARTEDGRETDWALLSHLQTHRPLLGVPFTVQETVPARGMRLRRGGTAERDAEAVAALRDAGGILLGTTRTVGDWWEVTEEVRLPHDVRRTVGDGGATLVAAAGTPLALCVGDSLLGPAAFCGVFAHAASPRSIIESPVLYSSTAITHNAHHTDIPAMKKTKTVDNLMNLAEDQKTRDARELITSNEGPSSADTADQGDYHPQVGVITRHTEDLRTTLRLLTRGPVQLGRLGELVPVSKLRVFTAELPALLVASVASRDVREILHRAAETLRLRGASVQRVQLPEAAHMLEIVRAKSSECDSVASVAMSPPARLLALLSTASSITLGQDSREHGLHLCSQLRRRLIDLLGSDGVLLYPVHPGPAPLRLQRHLRPLDGVAALLSAALQLPGCVVPCGRTAAGLPLGVQLLAGPGGGPSVSDRR